MTQSRHEPFEELISASLRHGDLTPEERDRLNRHLDTCADCRDTLAAFADQRRIVAGNVGNERRDVVAARLLGTPFVGERGCAERMRVCRVNDRPTRLIPRKASEEGVQTSRRGADSEKRPEPLCFPWD